MIVSKDPVVVALIKNQIANNPQWLSYTPAQLIAQFPDQPEIQAYKGSTKFTDWWTRFRRQQIIHDTKQSIMSTDEQTSSGSEIARIPDPDAPSPPSAGRTQIFAPIGLGESYDASLSREVFDSSEVDQLEENIEAEHGENFDKILASVVKGIDSVNSGFNILDRLADSNDDRANRRIQSARNRRQQVSQREQGVRSSILAAASPSPSTNRFGFGTVQQENRQAGGAANRSAFVFGQANSTNRPFTFGGNNQANQASNDGFTFGSNSNGGGFHSTSNGGFQFGGK